MQVNVSELMDGTVTVANCTPATDSSAEDVWQTTVLVGFWHEEESSTLATSTGVADGSAAIKVQIAESDADGYVEPAAYAGEGWTLRPGDKVINGSVEYSGGLSGLLSACDGLRVRVGTIDSVKDLRLDGATGALNGLKKWASVLYCEAV